MKIKLISIFTVAGVLVFPSFLKAQSYREEASVSPAYVYKEMLSSTQNPQRVLKLLGSVEGILEAINTNFGKDLKSDIKTAVSTGTPTEIMKAIDTLIYYDIKDVFRATLEGISKEFPLEKLKSRLKYAYLDYLLVSPRASRINFNLDRTIRKDFAEALTGYLARAVEGDISALKSKFDSIEDNYKNIFGL